MIRTASLAIASLVLLVLCGCLGGCAQNTETPTVTDQRQPQAQAAEQAQQGVNVRNTWNIIAYPPGLTSTDAALGDESGDQQAEIANASASPSGSGLAKARAGFQSQNGLSFYVAVTGTGTGTQTPTLTGGTLSSTQTPTVTPNQEPTANVTVPIAVGAPGSAPQATAQGQLNQGGTQTGTLSPQQQAELRTLLNNGDTQGALAKLAEFLGGPKPTTQSVP